MTEQNIRRGAPTAALLNVPAHRAIASAFLVLVAFGLSVLLAGCSQNETRHEDETEALPPVIVEVGELDGATLEISGSQPLVVNAPDPIDWIGMADDPEVAEFIPGKEDGGATYNPGFEARGPGKTSATMTSPEEESYDFTLVVK